MWHFARRISQLLRSEVYFSMNFSRIMLRVISRMKSFFFLWFAGLFNVFLRIRFRLAFHRSSRFALLRLYFLGAVYFYFLDRSFFIIAQKVSWTNVLKWLPPVIRYLWPYSFFRRTLSRIEACRAIFSFLPLPQKYHLLVAQRREVDWRLVFHFRSRICKQSLARTTIILTFGWIIKPYPSIIILSIARSSLSHIFAIANKIARFDGAWSGAVPSTPDRWTGAIGIVTLATISAPQCGLVTFQNIIKTNDADGMKLSQQWLKVARKRSMKVLTDHESY